MPIAPNHPIEKHTLNASTVRQRTIAQESAWAYSLTDAGLAVNLVGSNELNTTLLDGTSLSLSQQTDFPQDGKVSLRVLACKASVFDIQVRIPSWAKGATLSVNGEDITVVEVG